MDLTKQRNPNENGLADGFKKFQFQLSQEGNNIQDSLDPKKNGVADAFDPKKNGVANAFNPNKNGFNDFVHGVEDKANDLLNKIFGGEMMDKILLLVGGVAIIMLLKK